MTCPRCSCGGIYRCVECDALLGKTITREVDRRSQAADVYRSSFPRGPRGGALIDLSPIHVIECFVPYEAEDGELMPWCPMPLLGNQKIHDQTKSDPRACATNTCACDSPVGWRLTRPLIRVVAGWSDAAIYAHSESLPGRIRSCWCICVDTVQFMREVVFGDYRFPTRAESRAARLLRSHSPVVLRGRRRSTNR